MATHVASGGAEVDWKHAVEQQEEMARQAFLSRDIGRLADLWAEELTVNSPINRVLDRGQVFDLLQRGIIAHGSFEVHIEAMQRHGNVVVVMGHDVVTNAPDSPPVERRFTDVWRITGGSWRMVARHANVVEAASPSLFRAVIEQSRGAGGSAGSSAPQDT